jgi:hypothetical protein
MGRCTPPEPSGRTATCARTTDAGIARGPGLAVAGVTAAIVFVIGQQLFPIRPRQPTPPAPIATADAQAPTTAAPADAGAIIAAPKVEAGVVATKTTDAGGAAADTGAAGAPEKAAAGEPEQAKPAEEPTAGIAPIKPIDKQRQADRDLAREAWRRNRPDISVVGTRTALLVPIKGSIKGADFKITDKRRTVTVTLPKAVSMVTMRVYNLKHPSFKKLWIDQDEANAQAQDGTKLRLILSQAFDPQVEITDDFVRVTIRRPQPADEPVERSERSPKKSERGEKKSDSAEKKSEPSEEAAPPAEKEAE